jgi:hypothetical protein
MKGSFNPVKAPQISLGSCLIMCKNSGCLHRLLDLFRNSEIESSSWRTTGEDRSLLWVNEDRSQAFNNEID